MKKPTRYLGIIVMLLLFAFSINVGVVQAEIIGDIYFNVPEEDYPITSISRTVKTNWSGLTDIQVSEPFVFDEARDDFISENYVTPAKRIAIKTDGLEDGVHTFTNVGSFVIKDYARTVDNEPVDLYVEIPKFVIELKTTPWAPLESRYILDNPQSDYKSFADIIIIARDNRINSGCYYYTSEGISRKTGFHTDFNFTFKYENGETVENVVLKFQDTDVQDILAINKAYETDPGLTYDQRAAKYGYTGEFVEAVTFNSPVEVFTILPENEMKLKIEGSKFTGVENLEEMDPTTLFIKSGGQINFTITGSTNVSSAVGTLIDNMSAVRVNIPDSISNTEFEAKIGDKPLLIGENNTLITDGFSIPEGSHTVTLTTPDETFDIPITTVAGQVTELTIEETSTPKETELPFETIIEEDPNAYTDFKEVKQEGVVGKETVTTTTYTLEGKEVLSKEETKTVDPIDEIIVVGTKPIITTKEEVKEEKIPFETIVTKDPTLPKGERVVDQEGENGVKEVTELITFEKEVETKREFVKEEVTKEKVDQKERVGTLEWTDETRYEDIPFETTYIYDDTLDEGVEVVDQEGENGQITIVERKYSAEGVYLRTEELSRERKEPVTKIVRIGTKVTEIVEEKHTVEIPFEKENELDPTLLIGETKIKQEGVIGEKEITEEVTYINGEEVSRNKIGEEVTKEPVPEITLIGTLVVEERTEVEEIPFETETIYDDTLYEDYMEVKQEGEMGELTKTYNDYSGQGVEPKSEFIGEEVTKEPVKKIIVIGTKKVVTTSDEEERKEVPFETIIIEDDTLYEDYREVEQEGEMGEIIDTYLLTYEKGELVKRELVSSNDSKKPIDEIIRVGKKPIVTTKEIEETENLPFETEELEKPRPTNQIEEPTVPKEKLTEPKEDPTKEVKQELPKTGEKSTSVVGYILLGAAVVALLVVRKKLDERDMKE